MPDTKEKVGQAVAIAAVAGFVGAAAGKDATTSAALGVTFFGGVLAALHALGAAQSDPLAHRAQRFFGDSTVAENIGSGVDVIRTLVGG